MEVTIGQSNVTASYFKWMKKGSGRKIVQSIEMAQEPLHGFKKKKEEEADALRRQTFLSHFVPNVYELR